MGYSTQRVPFFTTDIKIRPHTATSARHINRDVTLEQFAGGERLALKQVLDGRNAGDYIARKPDGTFMQGPEV